MATTAIQVWECWRRTNLVLLAIAANAGIRAGADAGELPNLPDTILYKELAQRCRPVDLKGWNHPTRQVLRKYQVHLYSVELCNSDRYPIFHVRFKYDPMGRTDSFFAPFYKAMLSANGGNPMAFVESASGNVIVMISNDRGKPKAAFEQYNEK